MWRVTRLPGRLREQRGKRAEFSARLGAQGALYRYGFHHNNVRVFSALALSAAIGRTTAVLSQVQALAIKMLSAVFMRRQ